MLLLLLPSIQLIDQLFVGAMAVVQCAMSYSLGKDNELKMNESIQKRNVEIRVDTFDRPFGATSGAALQRLGQSNRSNLQRPETCRN